MDGHRLKRVIQRLQRTVGSPNDDPELLHRYAVARDDQAFTTLVQRHGPMVRGVCRRVLGQDADADDAFQATFLVLASKAGSIFWQESVAGWLYQVAYRTARKARAQAARRTRHEQAAGSRPEPGGVSPELRELPQVIDEELSRLPKKYRLPVLLCCLQDQTTDEAARQLGWSFTTVKGRLQRGREILRQRLQRRGVALSAGVLGTLLAGDGVGAVPAALLATTAQAALTGAVTAPVAALVEGVCKGMFWTRTKVVALVLAAVAIIGVGGIALSQMAPTGPVAEGAPAPAEKPRPAPQALLIVPNGVVDKDADTAYLVNPDHGIDALDLKTGKVLWQTPAGQSLWPLDVAGNRLVVRVRDQGVRIAVLDTAQQGKRLVTSESLPFPGWAKTYDWFDPIRTPGGPGAQRGRTSWYFSSAEKIDGNELIVEWKASQSTSTRMGINGQFKTETTNAAGVMRVDLKSGAIKAQQDAEAEIAKRKIADTRKTADAPDPVTSVLARFQAGDRDYIVEQASNRERTLKAKDRRSGKLLWEHRLLNQTHLPPSS